MTLGGGPRLRPLEYREAMEADEVFQVAAESRKLLPLPARTSFLWVTELLSTRGLEGGFSYQWLVASG